MIFDGEFDGAVSALEGRQLGVRSWIRVGSAAAGPANAESYDALTADAPSVPPAIAAGGDDILFMN